MLIKGEQSALSMNGDVVSFIRSFEGGEIFCAFNIGEPDARVVMPDGKWMLSEQDLGACETLQGSGALLSANQILVATKP